MLKFIIALDQGTTSSRAVLFDDKGMCLAIKQKEFRQIFPQQAWVEHMQLSLTRNQTRLNGLSLTENILSSGQILR